MPSLAAILILGLAFYLIYYFQSQARTKEIARLKREINILKRTQEHLENRNKSNEEFIYFVSHELKGPLAVIKGYISIILDGTVGKVEDKPREILEKIFASNEQIILLIEDLLWVSRLEGKRMKYKFQKQRLNDLLSAAVEGLSEELEAKKINLNLKLSQDIFGRIDIEACQEVFKKLLNHSIKTARQKIEIEARKKDGRLFISLKDDGQYPEASERKRYFAKALKKEERRGGTGLEMYICQRIISDHQGEIKLAAWPSAQGKQIIISLPNK